MAGLSPPPRLGVVADDVTGANDMGSMFARAGRLTHVYTYQQAGDLAVVAGATPLPEVAILDTNSRLDSPQIAYAKVHAATRDLLAAGCEQFHNKTCSVFRGNIGVEFDAMLDALGEDFAVVVLGFPKNGRTTVDGIHYVHGRRLEDSPFRHDPHHPTTRSNLVEILQSQTARRVGLADHTIVAQGAEPLRARLQALRGNCHYVIVDVPDQAALPIIAAAVHDVRVLCGSSALGEALPPWWPPAPPAPAAVVPPAPNGVPPLAVAGSLTPQTRAQIAHLRQAGAVALEVDTPRLATAPKRDAEINRVTGAAVAALRAGQRVIVHSPHAPTAIAATHAAGGAAGLDATAMARQVTAALAEIAAQVLAATGQNRVVVAGGETSAALCTRLGVRAMRVLDELAPGLPSCLALAEPPRLLVLKSGSFGSAAFLADALDYLSQR